MTAGAGLTSPGLQVEDAGYRRPAKLQQFYGSDYYVTDSYSAGPSARVYRDIPGGNNEIRELQRLFPETNWPPSLPERPLGFSTIQSALSIAGLKLLGEVV